MRENRENSSVVVIAVVLAALLLLLAGGGLFVFQGRRAVAEQQIALQLAVEAKQMAEEAARQAEVESELAKSNLNSLNETFVSQTGESSNATGKTTEAIDEESEIATIKALLFTQQDAWNEGNIEQFMEGYWKSDELTFSSGGKTRRSWQTTLEHYKQSYPTREKMGTLEFSELEVQLLSSDAAFVLGRWHLKELANGNFTILLRKLADGWVIIHDHSSQEDKP